MPTARISVRSRVAKLNRWMRTSDAKAVVVLVVVPVLMFVVPAILGYPAIAGDNAIQNFPLRVLTGRQIAQGHLPLWNPYLWSGSPLLGAMNSGSFYPGTMLFVIMAPVAAWVGNLLVAFWAASLGLYALLRQFRLRPLACVLAAITYTYAGAMSGQLVHLPIVQGIAWMPLMVLAQYKLSWAVLATGPTRGGRGSRWRWTVLLAGVLGLVLLTGEPRSMAEAEIVATVVTFWLVLRPYGGMKAVGVRARLMFVGFEALACVWASALGAAQLLPGWLFIRLSQRSAETYAYFGTGSLHPQWSVLMLVPDIFGGDGLLHQPVYFNSYNLPEVTGYVGLLPLVATAVLLTRSFGRRRDPRSSDWGLWMVLAGLGVLMAFGEFTWFGGVFGHIPFFDLLRLQSRNIAIADLALAALLGFWVERALENRNFGDRRWRNWVAVGPPLCALALCVAEIVVPRRLETAFGADSFGAQLGRELRPWIAVQGVLAVLVVAAILWWARLSPLSRRRVVAGLVALDVGLFVAFSSVGLSPGYADLAPSARRASAVFLSNGRFAIYDTTSINVDALSSVGQPDLNVMTGYPSVQGYGSILSSDYRLATGTHDLDTLDPCALAKGAFVPLRLSSLLTLPTFLAPKALSGVSGVHHQRSAGSCPGASEPGNASGRTFYFGQVLKVTSVELVEKLSSGPAQAFKLPRIGIVTPRGSTIWPAVSVASRSAGAFTARLASAVGGVGLVVAGGSFRAVSDRSEVTAQGVHYAMDGALQDALDVNGWRFSGNWRGFSRFLHPVVYPPVWIAGRPRGAEVTQVSTSDTGSAVETVKSRRAVTVVRSEAYLKGWTVTARSLIDGRSMELTVFPVGLVQGVRLPAGAWKLTYSYEAPGIKRGLLGTGLGLIGMLVAAAVYFWNRGATSRRSRREVTGR